MGKSFLAFDNSGANTPNRKLRRGKISLRNDANTFTDADRAKYYSIPNTDTNFMLVTDSNTYKGKSTSVATPVFVSAGSSMSTLRDRINDYRAGEQLGGTLTYYPAIDWWISTYNGLIYYKDRVFPTPLLDGNCRAVFDPAYEALGLVDARGYSADYSKVGTVTVETEGNIISWRFDGNGAIRTGGISGFNPDADYPVATTLNMWFKVDNTSPSQAVLSDNWGPEWGIWVGSGNVTAYAYGGTSHPIEANTWYLATLVTLDAYPASGTTTRKLYVNGQYIGTGASGTGNGMNDTPFTFGYDYKGGSPNNWLWGNIGHVSFWRDEMTASEIETLYEATKHSYGY